MPFTPFYENILLNKNELQLFKPHPVTTAQRMTLGASLGIPDEGIFVYDSDEDAHYSWDGTQWKPIFISELAQDAIGSILEDTPTIDLTYNDSTNVIKADLAVGPVDDNVPYILGWNGTNVTLRTPNFFSGEEAQDTVFNSLFVFNAITGAYDDDHSNFTIKLGGRVTENTVIFSNLNDFFDINFVELGTFGVDAQNINLVSTDTNGNFLKIDATSATLETVDGHVKLANNDVELKSFNGVVRVNSPLYLDNLSNTPSSLKVLTQSNTGIVTYRTISQLIADYGGVGVTSVGLTMPSAFNVSVSPITTSGTFAVTGAGTTAQYIRGDGSLATFPFIPPLYTDEMAQDTVFENFTIDNGLTYVYNDAGNNATLQLGGILLHDTTIDANAYKLILTGNTIYDYVVESRVIHDWVNGTGIMSWKGTAKLFIDGVPNTVPNLVRIGMNYTEAVYATSFENAGGSPLPGYFGDRIGYFLSTNLTGHGSFGQYVDESTSKSTGIFLHTKDTSYTDAVSIFGVPTSAYFSGALGIGSMASYKIATFHTNGTVQLQGYPNTRDDGGTTKALYVDATGNIKYGSIGSYNDESAQDAVGTILVDTASIDLTYSDATPSITADVKPQFLYDTLRIIKKKYRVGDDTAPAAAATTFTLVDCSGVTQTNKAINFFRERALQFEGDDYTYNVTTGLITVTEALEAGERLEFHIYPQAQWTTCTTVAGGGGNVMLINVADNMLINTTDSFAI